MLSTMSKQQFRDKCRQDKELCQAILEKYRTNNRYYWQDGWCEILELVPSKRHGYVQISANGFNKFAVLEEVVIWANGQEVKEGCDASHLCHRKLCCNLDHVVSEPKPLNQSRKNCLVWIPCPHCPLKIFTCQHSPSCIKFCTGFNNHEQFISEGICTKYRGN